MRQRAFPRGRADENGTVEPPDRDDVDDPNSAYRSAFSITQMQSYGSMVGLSRRARRWLLVLIVSLVVFLFVLAALS